MEASLGKGTGRVAVRAMRGRDPPSMSRPSMPTAPVTVVAAGWYIVSGCEGEAAGAKIMIVGRGHSEQLMDQHP